MALGFATALSLHNLLYSFIGVVVGNLIGVLPGIGALAAISMLLPITYGVDPAAALMMLAGLYYGATYGGAIASILLNLPGTAQHAVVCLDGNPMARQGRAGSALFGAMFASFMGATAGIIMIMIFSPLLSKIALEFGSTAYFALMFLGLIAASTLTSASALKGIAMVILGLILGLIGIDLNTGVDRFTFDIPELLDGLSLVAIAMGLFGVSDVLRSANGPDAGSTLSKTKISMRSMRPKKGEIRQASGSIVRGTGIGSFFGILPGTGGTLASFMSYALEKKIAKDPSRFGRGAIEGVTGPEAANSSGVQTAFIPTLTLGIPGDAVMALMLGAMLIHNIQPGPQLIIEHPTVFWGLIASFWIGNLLLLILNIPLIGLWVRLLSIPYRLIYPVVLFFICIGVYSSKNSLFDIWTVLFVGVVGYFLVRLKFEPAPLLLGFVLGPMVEENFRRSLVLSHGDLMTFFTDPISGVCMTASILVLVIMVYKQMRSTFRKRTVLFNQ